MSIKQIITAALLIAGGAILGVDGAFAAGDDQWSDIWSLAGVDDSVEDIVEWNGGIVVAGSFDWAGTIAAGKVAFWDGVSWSAIGEPFDADVRALAVHGGELYAGGDFTTSGASPISGLARWDGAAWQEVGGGVDWGSVYALASFGGEIVAAGDFQSVVDGSVSVGCIAGWDGASWSDFNGGTYDGYIEDLQVFDGSLYATGFFMEMGSAWATHVAYWDGSSWNEMNGGLLGEFGEPYEAEGFDLDLFDGELVVAGWFAEVGGMMSEGLAAWNGFTWTETFLGAGFIDGIQTVAEWNGSMLVHHPNWGLWIWNGIYWSNLTTDYGMGCNVMKDTSLGYFVGGWFNGIDSSSATHVVRLDAGGGWHTLGSGLGMDARVSAFAAWDGKLIAGGKFNKAGEIYASDIAAWDGTAWSPLGSGLDYVYTAEVRALAEHGGDLIVGGFFTSAGGGAVSHVARWDGATWHAMGSGSMNLGVSGLVSTGGELYATGSFGSGWGLGRWDGVDWQPQGGGISGSVQVMHDIVAYDGGVALAGAFTSVGGVPAEGVAFWDGVAWQSIGAGISGYVYDLHVHDGLLYAAGSFGTAGGAPGDRIAVWDGVSWSPVGGGMDNFVRELGTLGGDLFATGDFAMAGGQPAQRIARWDGTDWHAMGSGLAAEGHAFGAYDGDLFVGGEFIAAGGKPSRYIASWSPEDTSVPWLENAPTILAGVPNPSTGSTVFYHAMSRDGAAELRVFDLLGRRVAERRFEQVARGSQALAWDGRSARGEALPAGTYFVQVRSAGSVTRHRVTLLR